MLNWKPPEVGTKPRHYNTSIALQNKNYIKDDIALTRSFKQMQRCAKDGKLYETMAHSVHLLESLTGHKGLGEWVLKHFDEEF